MLDFSAAPQHSIKTADIAGKKVIVNASVDVLDKNTGEIQDFTRLKSNLQTLRFVADKAAKITIIGHAGRPQGQKVEQLSLASVANWYTNQLGQKVALAETITAANASTAQIVLLENIRFNASEKSKADSERLDFAKELSNLGEIYINEAFASYKPSTSTYELASLLPSYLGFNYQKELAEIEKLAKPERPFLAVMGGAKLSDKLETLQKLCESVDKVLIGGAMSYTLLAAQDVSIGDSLYEPDSLQVAKEILHEYADKIVLPIDHVTLPEFKQPEPAAQLNTTLHHIIPSGLVGVDIGAKTIALYKQEINKAQTILWNGPMGVFEWAGPDRGTKEIGQAIAQAQAYTIAGGGDSLTAINQFGLQGFDHVSTGGGALLYLLSGNTPKPLEVIIKQESKPPKAPQSDRQSRQSSSIANSTEMATPRASTLAPSQNQKLQVRANRDLQTAHKLPPAIRTGVNLMNPAKHELALTKSALVIYGTHSGNAELVSEAIAAGLKEAGVNAVHKRVELSALAELIEPDLIVMVSSTYKVGRLNDHFEKMYREIKQTDKLIGKPAAIVALGDSKHYDIFAEAADYLEEAASTAQMKQITPSLRIDGPPHDRLQEYKLWGKQLVGKF